VVTTRFQPLLWPQLECLILGNYLIVGSFTLPYPTLPIYLPTYLSTYLPTYPPTHPSIHPSIHPSVRPSVCLLTNQSLYLSNYQRLISTFRINLLLSSCTQKTVTLSPPSNLSERNDRQKCHSHESSGSPRSINTKNRRPTRKRQRRAACFNFFGAAAGSIYEVTPHHYTLSRVHCVGAGLCFVTLIINTIPGAVWTELNFA